MISPKSTLSCKEADRRAGEGHSGAQEKLSEAECSKARWSGLLYSQKVHACSVAQSCLTFCDPEDCSLPHSSVHGIFQARILECCHLLHWQVDSLPLSHL